MEPIENCKKCGKPGRIKDTFKKFRRGWVGCPNCKDYYHWVYTPRDAVKKWNAAQRGTPHPSAAPTPSPQGEGLKEAGM